MGSAMDLGKGVSARSLGNGRGVGDPTTARWGSTADSEMDQDGEMDVDTEAFDRLWELWDFGQPAVSEERFRAKLADADGEEALLARTQVARSLGLQNRFDECRAELDAVAERIAADDPNATPLVRAYERLERGRMHRSS